MACEWPKEWRRRQLGEVADVNWGDTTITKASYTEVGFPAFSASGHDGHLPYADFDRTGIVLSAIGADCGKTWLAKGKWSCIKNTIRFWATDPEVDTEFLYWLTRDPAFWPKRGSAQPFISQGDARAVEIAYPPLPEQRAIAHILGTLDDKIELLRRQNETLEAMARALFKAWFVDFEPVRAKMEGRWRRGKSLPGLPAHLYDLFPDRLVESELGEIPEGWRYDSLGSFTDIKNGYAFKSNDWCDKGVPVVKIGSIKPGFVDLNHVSFIDATLAKEKETFKLSVGDMLVGLTGYVGETGRIPPSTNQPILNQRVGKFEPFGNIKSFVFACVRMPQFKTFAENKAHGSAQANVSTKDLLTYPVANPGLELLNEFCRLSDPLFSKSLESSGEQISITSLRDTLLPKLISGELRVKDAEAFLKERDL